MKILHLHLKRVFFEQIKRRTKSHEYRLITPYWRKRIEGRAYDRILIHDGYPARGDTTRTISRPWRGYVKQTMQHDFFGPHAVQVYAIRVNS